MITDYKKIKGWFDYENVYDTVLEYLSVKLKRKLRVVEIGAWLGKSSFYLVQQHCDKADIYIIDTWKGSPGELHSTHSLATERDIYLDFIENMKIHHGKFTAIRSMSVDAAKLFQDLSVDFIFIDGDHTYEGVKSDIEAWQIKLTEFGVIAGHDYVIGWDGVRKAVNEKFGIRNIRVMGRSWIFGLPKINNTA